MIESMPFGGALVLAGSSTNGLLGWMVLLSIAVAVLVGANVVMVAITLLGPRRSRHEAEPSEWSTRTRPGPADSSFVGLREQSADIGRDLMQLSSLAASAGMRMTDFARAFERHAFGSWEGSKQLQERCQELLRAMIIFRDRIEQLREGRIPPDRVRSVAETCDLQIGEALSQAGVQEIPVQIGQPRDPSTHNVVGLAPGEQLKGVVLEVVRRGYAVADERGQLVPIRPAEVVVSSGPASLQSALAEAPEGPAGKVVPPGHVPLVETPTDTTESGRG